MDISEVISIALPIVYVLVGAALIWLVVELVMTVRRTRKTVEEVQKQVEPTLASVERITASLEPVAAKVDPLVERVSLTVDAANLEIMRVDQILEDVNEITDSVSSAVDAVDTVTSAPMELVNNVTNRMRSAFKPKRASDESVALGREKAADATMGDAVKSVAKGTAAVAGAAVADQREHMAEQRAEREEKAAAKRAAAPELTCHVESSLANAIGSLNEQLLEETIGLKTALETVSDDAEPETLLHYYHDEVEKRTNDVRKTVDKLEVLTASKYWPYPTFCELLFSV